MPTAREVLLNLGNQIIQNKQLEFSGLSSHIEGIGFLAQRILETRENPLDIKVGIALEEQFHKGRTRLFDLQRKLHGLSTELEAVLERHSVAELQFPLDNGGLATVTIGEEGKDANT